MAAWLHQSTLSGSSEQSVIWLDHMTSAPTVEGRDAKLHDQGVPTYALSMDWLCRTCSTQVEHSISSALILEDDFDLPQG